jgi:hypothetical protein
VRGSLRGRRYQLIRQRRYLIADGREPNIHSRLLPSDHPSLSTSVLDLGLDERGEVIERLLPAEITGLERDGRRQALLDDIDLRADRHRPQRDGGDHLTEQVRILEAIRVADQFIWNEIEVLAAESVRPSRGEIMNDIL